MVVKFHTARLIKVIRVRYSELISFLMLFQYAAEVLKDFWCRPYSGCTLYFMMANYINIIFFRNFTVQHTKDQSKKFGIWIIIILLMYRKCFGPATVNTFMIIIKLIVDTKFELDAIVILEKSSNSLTYFTDHCSVC